MSRASATALALPLVSVAWYLTNLRLLAHVWAFDATIYLRGSAAFLAGGDPWAASAKLFPEDIDFHYAALPTTTVALAPLAMLPEQVGSWLLVVAALAASVVTLRALRMPLWWLAYPPVFLGWAAGNPTMLIIAFMVVGRVRFLAPLLKAHAVIPMAGERRVDDLFQAGAAAAVTALAFPSLWIGYIDQAGAIASRLAAESNRAPLPVLLVALLALAFIAYRVPRRAWWLAIPTIWPQTHYAAFALPVMTRTYAIVALLPLPFATTLATIAAAAVLAARSALAQRDDRREEVVGAR